MDREQRPNREFMEAMTALDKFMSVVAKLTDAQKAELMLHESGPSFDKYFGIIETLYLAGKPRSDLKKRTLDDTGPDAD